MKRRPGYRRRRKGAILALSLALLTVVMLMAFALTRSMLTFHHQASVDEVRNQTAWLAEAGCQRAIRSMRTMEEYEGETWRVLNVAGDLDGIVTIQVEKKKIVVNATFPEQGRQFKYQRQIARE